MNHIERNVACVLVASCAENVLHRSVALKFSYNLIKMHCAVLSV